MIDDEERKERRAKAFAWRAIGCAVWLAIIFAVLFTVMMFLSAAFLSSPSFR